MPEQTTIVIQEPEAVAEIATAVATTPVVPQSGLVLKSEILQQVQDRYARQTSDGGSTGRTDANDNQNQMP